MPCRASTFWTRTELVRCKGSDLQVPAYAEIILEGTIRPGDEAPERLVRPPVAKCRDHPPVLLPPLADEPLPVRRIFVASAQAEEDPGRLDRLVLPVVAVDGQPVGDGTPGPLATRLRRLYIERAKASAI